ncbi:hypothetical protein OIE66_39425 [Nonomuraea sp. NBC_01738]|uniref:hypothetical protein n=1 Tax=Nonomuraea sp. NBC_01738 TaxID=2976003 RepID=UPI002E15B1CE|nr:hypothetical protein OIE66_39425 [Nonomuraea sp. NBC_01738]
MRKDPDHVLDAIDGVVDDWEATSADSMRWAPPEVKREELAVEVAEIFGPLVNALADLLRPVGEAIENAMDRLVDDDEEHR